MRTWLLRLIAIALILSARELHAAAPRAIWMWEEDSYAMVENDSSAQDAAAFLRSKNISTIYLYADAYRDRNLIASHPEAYRRLITGLHRQGIKVYALLGSAYLHTEEYVLPNRREAALAMFQRVLTFNTEGRAEERFDGVNLDIEPHILDQWSSQKEQLLKQFLELGRAFMDLKRSSSLTLAVGPAIPFWLDGIDLEWNGHTKSVSEHVFDIYDYAALMDYRDHAEGSDGIITHALDEMGQAGRTHKRLVIGVDITPGELAKLSFAHLTEPDLERELKLTENAFQKTPAFGGFALHHYHAYRTWVERTSKPVTHRPE